MINQNDLDLIHKFLDRELAQEEIPLFKEKMKNDPEFAREVKIYTNTLIAIKASVKTRNKIIVKEKSKMFPYIFILLTQRKYMMAALIAVLIIVGGGIISWQIYKRSDTGIYYSYYEVPSGYTSHGYMGKVNEPVITKDTEPEALFYFGIYNMEKKNYKDAIKAFELLLQQPDDNLFKEDAEWYLSLSYLRNEAKNEAILLLQKIRDTNNKHSKSAAEIIKMLVKKP